MRPGVGVLRTVLLLGLVKVSEPRRAPKGSDEGEVESVKLSVETSSSKLIVDIECIKRVRKGRRKGTRFTRHIPVPDMVVSVQLGPVSSTASPTLGFLMWSAKFFD